MSRVVNVGRGDCEHTFKRRESLADLNANPHIARQSDKSGGSYEALITGGKVAALYSDVRLPAGWPVGKQHRYKWESVRMPGGRVPNQIRDLGDRLAAYGTSVNSVGAFMCHL
jgi:hypothetical protein